MPQQNGIRLSEGFDSDTRHGDAEVPDYINEGFIAEQLQTCLQTQATPMIKGSKRLDINTGLASIIYALQVSWNRGPRNQRSESHSPTPNCFGMLPDLEGSKRLPENVVLKLPTLWKAIRYLNSKGEQKDQSQSNSPSEMHRMLITKLHNTECISYDIIRGIRPPLKIPKCYGFQMADSEKGIAGAIALADLDGEAHTPNLVKGLTVHQVYDILDNLAGIHAFSVCTREWRDNKHLQVMFPERFRNLTKWTEEGLKIWKSNGNPPLPCTDAELLQLADPIYWAKLVCSYDDTDIPVLCHGDLWANNILVHNEDGRLVAILDWQTCHIGAVGEDMARLFMQNVSFDDVAEHFEDFVHHYVATLKGCLWLYDHYSTPITEDYVIEQYDRHMGYGALMTFFQATVWRQNIEKNIEQSDYAENAAFIDRICKNIGIAVEKMKKQKY